MSNDANPAAEYLQSAETPDQPLTETAAASGPPEPEPHTQIFALDGSGGANGDKAIVGDDPLAKNATVGERDERGRFVAGVWQGGPGRPPGSKNRRTILRDEVLDLVAVGAENLPDRATRLIGFLTSDNLMVRWLAEKALLEQDWGKPTETIEQRVTMTAGILVGSALSKARDDAEE